LSNQKYKIVNLNVVHESSFYSTIKSYNNFQQQNQQNDNDEKNQNKMMKINDGGFKNKISFFSFIYLILLKTHDISFISFQSEYFFTRFYNF